MKVENFKPNNLDSLKISNFLNTLKKSLETDKYVYCLQKPCSGCPFVNIYKGSDYNTHCLPDYFYEKDDEYNRGMYGRFYYAYNYYIEHFVTKHKQEEMDV